MIFFFWSLALCLYWILKQNSQEILKPKFNHLFMLLKIKWKITFKFHTNRVRCFNVHFSSPYPNAKAYLISRVSTIMSSMGDQTFFVSNTKPCAPFAILIVLHVHTNVNQPAWLHPVRYSHRSREPGTRASAKRKRVYT